MSYTITAEMRELEKPGACTTCGAYARFRNSAGQCMTCHNASVTQWHAERKAQLAAMPRCEFCNRRAVLTTFGVPLCRHHFKIAEGRLANRLGIFGLGARLGAEDIRETLRS